MRFESSNQLGNRRLSADLEIGGERLAAGTYLHIGIGAANRDPAQFADPDRFDAGREPNRHFAFGSGVHMCLGAVLARMEGTIAIGRLVGRFDGLARDGASSAAAAPASAASTAIRSPGAGESPGWRAMMRAHDKKTPDGGADRAFSIQPEERAALPGRRLTPLPAARPGRPTGRCPGPWRRCRAR